MDHDAIATAIDICICTRECTAMPAPKIKLSILAKIKNLGYRAFFPAVSWRECAMNPVPELPWAKQRIHLQPILSSI